MSRVDTLHPPPSLAYRVDLEDFQAKVVEASRSRPVLVDFWADWCAPCHAIAPHLDRAVAELSGRVALAKVEVDEGENMKLAGHFRLRGFPTVMLFLDGEPVAHFSGAKPLHYIREFLQQRLPA